MTSMPTDNVFLRNDTIFGACQAIGDDFGFNPNYIRVPLAAAMLASPLGAIAFYLGLSVLVLASRLLFRSKEVPASAAAAPVAELLVEANDDQRELIAA
jgi:phage shock protein C